MRSSEDVESLEVDRGWKELTMQRERGRDG